MKSNLQYIGKNVIRFARKAWSGSPWHIFILAVVALLALIPAPAHGLVAEFFAMLFSGLNAFFGVFINLLAAIVQWLISPTTFEFVQNEAVVRAWRMVRDFVNLGFVLAIVVIAIGFILRLQTYGSSKTLSRLIIAAILVNFSLVIAGLFIDVSALITGTFLERFNLRNIATNLMSSTGFSHMWLPDPNRPFLIRAVGFLMRFHPYVDAIATANVVTKGILTSMFSIMMIATLGALIIMLLIRTARLWFLLVLAPVAWFSWIFPALEKNWHKWWDEFLRWTFFAPIVVFFLALSLSILGPSESPTTPPPTTSFWGRAIAVFQSVWREAIQSTESVNALAARFFLAITLIIFSMMMANQLSITFADTGLKWARGIAVWPGLTAWRAGAREGSRRFATGRMGQWVKDRTAGMPFGLGGISRKIGEMQKVGEKETEAARAELEVLRRNPDRLANIANGAGVTGKLLTEPYRLAALQLLGEENELGRISPSRRDALMQRAHQISPELARQMLQAAPVHLLDAYNAIPGIRQRDMQWALNRMTDEQLLRMRDTDLQQERIARALSVGALRHIDERGSDTQIQATKQAWTVFLARVNTPGYTPTADEQRSIDRYNKMKLNPAYSHMNILP